MNNYPVHLGFARKSIITSSEEKNFFLKNSTESILPLPLVRVWIEPCPNPVIYDQPAQKQWTTFDITMLSFEASQAARVVGRCVADQGT